jgi:hypothetical protein
MRSLTSLVRALLGSAARKRRPIAPRARLAVESLEGRALPSTSPLLSHGHHDAPEVQHQKPEHGPEIQIEHATALSASKSQAADDRGANRRQDGANDKNDDRGVDAKPEAKEVQAEHQRPERPERHGGLDG